MLKGIYTYKKIKYIKYVQVLSNGLPMKIPLLFHAFILLSSILFQNLTKKCNLKKYEHVPTGTVAPILDTLPPKHEWKH